MSPKRGSTNRAIRLPDVGLWDRFGELTDDRSAVIRAFIHWYVGDEGWPAPTRSAEPIAETDPPHSRT